MISPPTKHIFTMQNSQKRGVANFGRMSSEGGNRLSKKPSEPYRFKWRHLLFIPFLFIMGLFGSAFNQMLNVNQSKAIKNEHTIQRQTEEEDRSN
jgi:hypothetical protein